MKLNVKKIDEKIYENYTKIKIGGLAEIYKGDELISKCKNKFTRYLMSSIVVFIANGAYNVSTDSHGTCYTRGMAYGVTARIGTDTHTPTNPNMSDLVNKVDVASNSVTRRLIKEPDYTLYIAEFVFIWNVGTLPNIYIGAPGDGSIDGKVGEFGVYLYTDNDDWSSGLLNPVRVTSIPSYSYAPLGGAGVRLASRIASADGAFDAFEFYGSIDPLTFKWRFQVAVI